MRSDTPRTDVLGLDDAAVQELCCELERELNDRKHAEAEFVRWVLREHYDHDPDEPIEFPNGHPMAAALTRNCRPTEEGIKRSPPDGYYEGRPCTCKATCPPDCKGKCKCRACAAAYQDFLSVE